MVEERANERLDTTSAQPAAARRVDPTAAGGHGGTYADPRLLRAARVGDGAPDVGRATRLAAAARVVGNGRGRRVAQDRVLALRRVPVLHRLGTAAEHAPAGPRRPGVVRAAGVPARGDGPLQARVPAHPAGAVGAGGRLLRAGLGHPRARHARLAVRLQRPGLRAGPHRDAGGQAGVRRRPARLRRARRSPAPAADRASATGCWLRSGFRSPSPASARGRCRTSPPGRCHGRGS